MQKNTNEMSNSHLTETRCQEFHFNKHIAYDWQGYCGRHMNELEHTSVQQRKKNKEFIYMNLSIIRVLWMIMFSLSLSIFCFCCCCCCRCWWWRRWCVSLEQAEWFAMWVSVKFFSLNFGFLFLCNICFYDAHFVSLKTRCCCMYVRQYACMY